MGQYFKLVNPEKQEYVDLPGLMKAVERVTNPVAMGMVGYLLLEGPLDGTGPLLSLAAELDDEVREQAIEDFIELEREREERRLQRYLEERPSFVVNSFTREHGVSPDDAPEKFEEHCKKKAWSTYRHDNLNWDRRALTASGMANLQISEALGYAGRWAGDAVMLVGDYSELDYYDETGENWRYEYEGEEFVNYATTACPIDPASIERDDIMYSTFNREPEPGDLARIKHPDRDNDYVYAHYVGVEPQEWDDITDGLIAEFVALVGEDWVDGHDNSGIMAPDMVITSQ